MGELGHGGVRVHAQDAGLGEQLLKALLRPLGAEAGILHILAVAHIAGGDGLPGKAAVVADKLPVAGMVGQGDGAVGTDGHCSALAAPDDGVVPPAVEEEDGLLALLQVAANLLGKLYADSPLLHLIGLVVHIHHPHTGQGIPGKPGA